ncbi:pyridoxal-phosphate dependent enzyme [Actinacidiphila sp. DG2A-62]|nr:pyridoxal-phosphate dependent enzyme [Actinacidiphila sp. DG2A-62]MEC3996939.1 pyridoxal-phosphate dependent enzyme [Actinacidiphila sp. DG2A-62]
MPEDVAPSPLVEVDEPRAARRGVRLLLKRDDLVHPELVGNKYRKLLLNLAEARRAGHDTLLTFGGAYSNHLRATARAGRLYGFRTVGVVRGQELAGRPLNPSLATAAADGMRLHFVERGAYRRLTGHAARTGRHASEGQVGQEEQEGRAAGRELVALLAAYGPAYVLPEGGSNAAAVRGCAGLGRELAGRADVAVVACGTGGTLAGLAAGFPGEAVGVAVLRGGFLGEEVLRLQHAAYGGRRGRWRVEDGFHHGGYARTPPELDAFAAGFARRHGLRPEPVYVAKALYAALELTDAGAFARGSRVAVVITG